MTDNTKRIEQARELLTMIEEVDCCDSNKLDEIDARWWCCRLGHTIETLDIGIGEFTVKETNGFYCLEDIDSCTRSRDALKAARPEGWIYTTTYSDEGERATGLANMNCTQEFYQVGNHINHEIIAEFHAIVQAWIYVWENKE